MEATADTPLTGPPYPVIAYCAPGFKSYAARLLQTRGEQYTHLTEHPWMAGRTDVMLSTCPDGPACTDHR